MRPALAPRYTSNRPVCSATIANSIVQGSGGSASWDTSLGENGGGNLDVNPLFVDAPNGDLYLQSISPAMDAGNNNYVPTFVTTDLDGNPRIVGSTVDMGTYEVQIVDMIEHLKAMVESLSLANGIATSLIAKLGTQALEDGNLHNDISTFNKLNAFVNEVQALSGEQITTGDANELIAYAEAISAALASQLDSPETIFASRINSNNRVFLPSIVR